MGALSLWSFHKAHCGAHPSRFAWVMRMTAATTSSATTTTTKRCIRGSRVTFTVGG
jgi:hypothetical protein